MMAQESETTSMRILSEFLKFPAGSSARQVLKA